MHIVKKIDKKPQLNLCQHYVVTSYSSVDINCFVSEMWYKNILR